MHTRRALRTVKAIAIMDWAVPYSALRSTHGDVDFCRAMLSKRGLCRHAVSVCLSVCHVREFCQNETCLQIFFLPSGSHIILVYRNQAIFGLGPPNGSVECRWGRPKSRLLANIWLSIDDC